MPELNSLKYKIILASGSPRRQSLLKELGLDFRVELREIDEVYPPNLMGKEIAEYLAGLKAAAFKSNEIPDDHLLITADTIVCVDDKMLAKPEDFAHAKKMLQLLSGRWHEVITGVCLKSNKKQIIFSASTQVRFKTLTLSEINYYIENYKPYDKAGAYGIQEWIGFIGISEISGSFHNVMGLPVQKLYEELIKF
ncbi:MAG: septum formation protein Maf [Bacteroidetes bacterium HGW-Bacteroidetes-17]|jgi:septum formation protein|nr:MAG: septum formation protein Maf [Bacteroidetes bacterium HGW-Bacteroidetes-17]